MDELNWFQRFLARAKRWGRIILAVVVVGAVVLLILSILIAGQGGVAGQYAVLRGTATDYINTFDHLPLGFETVSLRNIHDMGFCTSDPQILADAMKYSERELYVALDYRTINAGDAPAFGCEQSTEIFTIYLLTGLRPTTRGMDQNLELEERLGLVHDPFFDVKP